MQYLILSLVLLSTLLANQNPQKARRSFVKFQLTPFDFHIAFTHHSLEILAILIGLLVLSKWGKILSLKRVFVYFLEDVLIQPFFVIEL